MLNYLSDICALLSDSCEKMDAGHPLVIAEACLPSKVVDMLYESFEYIFESRIRTLIINCLHIFCDVLSREILELRRVAFRGTHAS